jgi:putative Ca2+/H+ antiporter (TMEM165/GDT1 family)
MNQQLPAFIIGSLLAQRFPVRLVQQLLATVLLLVGLKTLTI